MKKTMKMLCLIMVICLIGGLLAACGGSSTPPPAADNQPQQQQAPQQQAPEAPQQQAPEAPAQVKTFKLSFGQPAQSPTGRGYAYFAEQIEAETGGSIKVEVYPAGTLFTDAEIFDALLEGSVEMAHIATSYMSPTIKELTPAELPGTFRSDRHMEFAYGLRDVLDEICQKYDLKYVMPCAGGRMNIVSVNKLITKPEDLKGLNVRASGKWIGEAIKAWGGNPVTLPLSEVTTALERKTIDAVYCGDVTVSAPFKLYEMAKYITVINTQETLGGVIMSNKAWNELTDDQVAAFERAIDKWQVYAEGEMIKEAEAYAKALEANGNEVYVLSEEENQIFIEQSLALLPQIEEFCGPEGMKLIEEMAELRKGYVNEYKPMVIPGK